MPNMAQLCGCYVYNQDRGRIYLPQLEFRAHTTIVSTASRTKLVHLFINDSEECLPEIRYAFPLYDGVSVVDFFCHVGYRTIYSLVKEKNEAKKTYEKARERGENAALLEQVPQAADVFTTTISNIPAGALVQVCINYVQELHHDAEVDGVRLTIPMSIAPRYGDYPSLLRKALEYTGGMSITVDIDMGEGTPIKKITSPSHPIQVRFGLLSNSDMDEEQSLSRGSATLALGTAELEHDFVLQVVAKDVGVPQVILETHPTLPNQRALMATLVPKFNLKPEKPEIILIADRSGSMLGPNIETLKAALKVFLKSIPLGCTFNICSFGSWYKFLWDKSRVYDEDTLTEAIEHVETFRANFDGTETLNAIQGCFKIRNSGSPTEMILLTDGDIWQQGELFNYVRQETESGDVRIFPLGIGGGVSSALIEGVARAGRGFAQMVAHNEKMDGKIVRMLKGALTPHIKDYRLEVKYEDDTVDTVADSLNVHLKIADSDNDRDKPQTQTQPISLYDPEATEESLEKSETEDIFATLPDLKRPTLLQTPHEIPALFPFHRTCIYLIMAPESSHLQPKSVLLKATCPQGPLELEIPVKLLRDADEMIHQLAARKAIKELEEGHGWISDVRLDNTDVLLKQRHASIFALLQRREAVRLGVEFQVGGKYCSFVAIEADRDEMEEERKKALEALSNRGDTRKVEENEDWEVLQTPASAESDGQQAQPTSRIPYKSSDSIISSYLENRNRSYRGGLYRGRGGHRSGSFSTRPVDQHKAVAHWAAPSASQSVPRCPPSIIQTGKIYGSTEEECEEEESDEDMGYALFDDEDYTPIPPRPSITLLQSLISLQSFSGAWPTISTLPLQNMRISHSDAHNALETLTNSNKAPDALTADRIFVTALVICFLETKMADEEETWELVVEKARAWLQETTNEQELDGVWKTAKELVGASEGFDEFPPDPVAAPPQRQKYGLFD